MKLAFALALLLPSSASAGKRYASLLIDRVDMTASLSEPLGLFSSEKSYFERWEQRGGGFWIEDWREGSRRGTYHFTKDGRLRHRTETLLVLEGELGAVFAELNAWHQSDKPRTTVNTAPYSRSNARQAGQPAEGTGKAVSGFALVRVLKAAPKFLIASADYALDGSLQAFHVNASTGDWRHSNEVAKHHPFQGGSFYGPGIDAKAAEKLGVPLKIDPAAFLASPFASLPEPGFPHELDAALVYRDRGEFVDRQVRRGSRVEKSRLRFPPTELERALLKTESARPFSAGE